MTGPVDPSTPLGIATVRNAVLVPTRNRSVYRDIDGVVLHADLSPVEAAFLTRNWVRGQITAVPDLARIDLSDIEEVFAPHVFGGYFFDHFGHFLLESLARSWAVRETGDLPIVWAAGAPPNRWQAEILEIIGIGSRVVFPDRPTRFRELLVPQPGYRIQGEFHPTQIRHLGRFPCRTGSGTDKVWLSRAHVTASRRAPDEARLERELARRGWRIEHPETLSVADQLTTMCGAGVVAGLEGSAFHGVVLLDGPSAPLIVLRHTRNRNYPAIAAAKGIVELDLFGAFSIDDRDSRELAHPETTARQVDAAATDLLAAGSDAAARQNVKARYEAEHDDETWRRVQARRLLPHARAMLRRRLRRHPRLARLAERVTGPGTILHR